MNLIDREGKQAWSCGRFLIIVSGPLRQYLYITSKKRSGR
ncbi:unnamed protein product [Brassica oleracea var. botrytis]